MFVPLVLLFLSVTCAGSYVPPLLFSSWKVLLVCPGFYAADRTHSLAVVK